MYSCFSGNCFLKPVSILSCDMASAMPMVISANSEMIAYL